MPTPLPLSGPASASDPSPRLPIVILGTPPRHLLAWWQAQDTSRRTLILIAPGKPFLYSQEWRELSGHLGTIAYLDPQTPDLFPEGDLVPDESFSPGPWPDTSGVFLPGPRGHFHPSLFDFLPALLLEVDREKMLLVASGQGHGQSPLLPVLHHFFMWYFSGRGGSQNFIVTAERFILAFTQDPLKQVFFRTLSRGIGNAWEKKAVASRDAEPPAGPAPPAPPSPPWVLLYEKPAIYQAQINSLVRALQRQGIRTRLLPLIFVDRGIPLQQEGARIFLRLELACYHPGTILTVNTLWPTYREMLPPGIPLVSWVQDILYYRERTAGDLAFFLTRSWMKKPHHRYWPIAADEIYTRETSPARGPWTSDFSYLGVFPPRYPPGNRDPFVSAVCDRYLAYLYEEEWFGSDTERVKQLLARAIKSAGVSQVPTPLWDSLLTHGHLNLPRHAQRHRLISFLLANRLGTLRLFGPGWEHDPRFAPHAGGILDPGPAIALAYRTTRINLHINGDTNVHQRVFESLACGGFLMVAAHESDGRAGGLHEFLTPGREYVVFHHLSELMKLSRYYLENEEERLAIAAAGQARVLREHTYDSRVTDVIREVSRLRGETPSRPPFPVSASGA